MSTEPGTIVGFVVDASGAPVAGAPVAIIDSPGPHSDIAALTGQNGGFRFGKLMPGPYKLSAFKAGRGSRQVTVQVEAGQQTDVEIRLAEGGATGSAMGGQLGGVMNSPQGGATQGIVGKVFDASGAPVADAAVAIVAGPGTHSDKAALTGVDGSFRFGNLTPGAYRLAVSKTGHAPHQPDVMVVSGQQTDLEIHLND